MAITVLAVADAVSEVLYDHFQPERWRGVDLVLAGGDLPPNYLDFLSTTLNVPVVYVRGNHDGIYHLSQYDGCINAHGRIVEYNGLRIAGFEGSRRYNGRSCQYTEGEMRRVVHRTRVRSRLIGKPHIVLAHAPPAGCHDADDQCHQGFACFRAAIEAWRPSLFVHGHVHAYNGGPSKSMLGSTTVVNAYRYRLLEVPEVAERPARWRQALTRVPRLSHLKREPAGIHPAGRELPTP